MLFIAGAISDLAGRVQNVINIFPNPVILEMSKNWEHWGSSNKVIHITYSHLIQLENSTNLNDYTLLEYVVLL